MCACACVLSWLSGLPKSGPLIISATPVDSHVTIAAAVDCSWFKFLYFGEKLLN